MNYRNYSDDDKAVALAMLEANGNNIKRTAKQLDIPFATLRRWQNQENGISESVLKSVPEKRVELSDRFEELAHRALDVAVTNIEEATAMQAATIAAIATEKMHLLRGKATENVSIELLDDEQRATRVDELLNRARARRDGQALDGSQ